MVTVVVVAVVVVMMQLSHMIGQCKIRLSRMSAMGLVQPLATYPVVPHSGGSNCPLHVRGEDEVEVLVDVSDVDDELVDELVDVAVEMVEVVEVLAEDAVLVLVIVDDDVTVLVVDDVDVRVLTVVAVECVVDVLVDDVADVLDEVVIMTKLPLTVM